jgi:hypothetical protein
MLRTLVREPRLFNRPFNKPFLFKNLAEEARLFKTPDTGSEICVHINMYIYFVHHFFLHLLTLNIGRSNGR